METQIVKQEYARGMLQFNREGWSRDDYVNRIQNQISSSLCVICTLLKELKEKFFSDETDEGLTWTQFCKDRIGISRHAVASYLRIGKYVLPRIEESLADSLGAKKLIELSKLGDSENWDTIKDQLHGDMSMKQVKNVVSENKQENTDPLIKLKKRKTSATLRRNIETLDQDLQDYLPDPDSPRTQERYKELSNELYNSMQSLMNMMNMMMEVADD